MRKENTQINTYFHTKLLVNEEDTNNNNKKFTCQCILY